MQCVRASVKQIFAQPKQIFAKEGTPTPTPLSVRDRETQGHIAAPPAAREIGYSLVQCARPMDSYVAVGCQRQRGAFPLPLPLPARQGSQISDFYIIHKIHTHYTIACNIDILYPSLHLTIVIRRPLRRRRPWPPRRWPSLARSRVSLARPRDQGSAWYHFNPGFFQTHPPGCWLSYTLPYQHLELCVVIDPTNIT